MGVACEEATLSWTVLVSATVEQTAEASRLFNVVMWNKIRQELTALLTALLPASTSTCSTLPLRLLPSCLFLNVSSVWQVGTGKQNLEFHLGFNRRRSHGGFPCV